MRLVRVADVAEGKPDTGKGGEDRLGEADHVEGDGDGLRDEEEDGDDAAELHAQAAADEIVGAAALDAHVGRDGGDGQARDQRDGLGAGEDQQGVPQARVAHDGVEPQEHDHAEDRQQARGEHAAKGAEQLGF